MISTVQIRGALAMLGWSKSVAAEKAGIGEATIQRIRLGQPVTPSNRDRLIEAMESSGIEFGEDGAVKKI